MINDPLARSVGITQEKKFNICLEIITCEPSIYIMDHPDFIVCSFMENFNGHNLKVK